MPLPPFIPPMVAPPQPFQYFHQELPDEAYRTLGLNPDSFAFLKREINEELEEMLEHMEIPIYGPMTRTRDAPKYGNPQQVYEQAQFMSQMRFEGESTDPTFGNVYTGERDENGFREGFGTMTFSNGAIYMGQWWQGLRHGYGTYSLPNGANYSGQWAHDLKHGMGRYRLMNGLEIRGIWIHDRLNGRAIRKLPGQSSGEEVVFKDDLAINLELDEKKDKMACMKLWGSILTLLFVLFLLGGLYGIATGNEFSGQFFFFAVLILIGYNIWMCTEKTSQYLGNVLDLNDVFANIDKAV